MIKLVRCPYQRAVSSYFHSIKHEKIYKEISETFKKSVSKNHTFTFEEFVEFLSATDISKSNPHFRSQTWIHEINRRMKFYRVIKIEDSINEFRNPGTRQKTDPETADT